jgi:hypothetical protein
LAVAFPQPEEVVGLVGETAMQVKPGERLSILRDEADNRLLEAAAEAAADYIVTGDPSWSIWTRLPERRARGADGRRSQVTACSTSPGKLMPTSSLRACEHKLRLPGG